MDNILEVKNLSFSYHSLFGETKAIDSISFSVKPGSFLAIVGPSGCGKSTLLSIISGLLQPDEGTVVKSHDYNIGYMLQKDTLFEWKSVYANACLGPVLQKSLSQEKIDLIDRLFTEYGLEDSKTKRPSELSGGMKQRVALIRTLALEPELLLLDEPFSALDYQTRLNVSEDICRLIKETGKSMILITHDLGEAISIADKVIVLSKRPASIKCEMDISLPEKMSSLEVRSTAEYNTYFNLLWKALNNDSENDSNI